MRALYLSAMIFIISMIFTPFTAQAQLRPMVYTEKTVNAPIDQVWADWTTAEGLESFFAPKAIMPPYMETIRPHMTIVQLWFVPQGETQTRLRLFHTGFGDTKDWQEGRDYFAKTWPDVMHQYADHLRQGD